jgi:hypothetical protein
MMLDNLQSGSALAALVCVAVASMTGSAWAVTAEVAKNCAIQGEKRFPPLVLGNPAAGSAKGTGQGKLNWLIKCRANGGHMNDDAPPASPAPPAPPR